MLGGPLPVVVAIPLSVCIKVCQKMYKKTTIKLTNGLDIDILVIGRYGGKT